MIGDGRGHADEAYHDSQDATGCSTGTVTVVTVPQYVHNTIGYPLPEKAVATKKWVGFRRNPTYSSDWDWSVTCHPSHCHYPISAGIALVTPVTVTTQSQLGFLCDS